MEFFDSIYTNYLYSLYSISPSPLWQESVINYHQICIFAFAAVFIIAVITAFRIRTGFSVTPRIYAVGLGTLGVSAAAVALFIFLLTQNTLSTVMVSAFLTSVIVLMSSSGFILGFYLRQNQQVLLYVFGFAVLLAAAYAAVFFSDMGGQKTDKESLRERFKTLTGHSPNDEEKGLFWKATVGEEQPSETKKNEYWNK
jgi:lysylphosphatidylglycerol synthetase-like protein (DUF2156 family)